MAPAVAEFEAEYRDQIRFIGVSGQDNPEEMQRFVADHGVDGFDHIADLRSEIWLAFEITAQPSFVFINDDGTIARHIGSLEHDAFAAALEGLL